MKIGILTFHRAINYGAFLQAFALKHYLTTMGHSVELIDYWPTAHEATYTPFFIHPNASVLGKIRSLLYIVLRYKRFNTRRNKMLALQYKYLGINKQIKYTNITELSALNLDCVIYGSDQIWWKSTLPNYTGFDDVYFGAGIPNKTKKIAYAPSMGVMAVTPENKECLSAALKRFSALSVRETELQTALQPLTEQPIEVVLDPVFLLSKAQWQQYCSPIAIKEKYVLFYNLMYSEKARKEAAALAKKRNCKLIEVTGKVEALKFGASYIQTAHAFEFLSYIQQAECVVSTSFHGVAFSILFEKEFYALGMQNNSGRVASLLAQMGIIDRLVDNEIKEDTPIDYTAVRSKLDQAKEKSLEYLTESLKIKG